MYVTRAAYTHKWCRRSLCLEHSVQLQPESGSLNRHSCRTEGREEQTEVTRGRDIFMQPVQATQLEQREGYSYKVQYTSPPLLPSLKAVCLFSCSTLHWGHWDADGHNSDRLVGLSCKALEVQAQEDQGNWRPHSQKWIKTSVDVFLLEQNDVP